MDKRKLLQPKEFGSAMALVLLAVVILLVMGTGLLSLSLHGQMLAIRTNAQIAARSAADAGLTKGLFEMNEKLKVAPWDGSSLPQATGEALLNSDAAFGYTVTGDANSGFTVESIGNSGRAERRVRATLRLRGLFENAILAENSIVVDNSGFVDGYNSEDGAYGGDNALQDTSIVTNSITPGAVVLNEAAIYGDVATGYGMDLPEMLPPTGGTFDVNNGIINSSVVFGPNDSGRYGYIELRNADTLSISGDVTLYVTGDITVDQASIIEILAGSSLTLYVGGSFSTNNSAQINNLTKEPKRCLIYGVGGSGQIFSLSNGTVFYGVIYAPDADVDFNNASQIYGAVVANNVEISNSAALHYDASLGEVSINDVGVRFVVRRWQEE